MLKLYAYKKSFSLGVVVHWAGALVEGTGKAGRQAAI